MSNYGETTFSELKPFMWINFEGACVQIVSLQKTKLSIIVELEQQFSSLGGPQRRIVRRPLDTVKVIPDPWRFDDNGRPLKIEIYQTS